MPNTTRTESARVRAARPGSQRLPLLSSEELASFLGVPLKTIYRWRSRGEGPVAFKDGRHVRYGLDDIHDWVDSGRA